MTACPPELQCKEGGQRTDGGLLTETSVEAGGQMMDNARQIGD